MTVAVLAFTSVSCFGDNPTVTAPSVSDISAGPAYAIARANPLSQGKQHNAFLDSGFKAIKAYSETHGHGRPVRKSVACRIFADFASSRVRQRDVIVTRQIIGAMFPSRGPSEQRGCDLELFRGTKPSSLGASNSSMLTRGPAATSSTMDDPEYDQWFDEQWDSAWSDAEDEVTVDDDLDTIDEWEPQIVAVVTSASSLADVVNGMPVLMGQATFSDNIAAALIGEVAELAVSSAEYWDENFAEWKAGICGDEPDPVAAGDARPASASAQSSEFCGDIGDPSSQVFSNALFQIATEDDWEYARMIALADIAGSLGIVKDMIEGIQAAHAAIRAYALTGQQVPNIRVTVRAMRPASRQVLMRAAGAAFRTTLVGNLAVGAVASGAAWLASEI